MTFFLRPVRAWLGPTLHIARRLGCAVSLAILYTAVVCLVYYTLWTDRPEWISEVGAINAVLVSVLIGFRTKVAYDRWWDGRSLWGLLVNHSRNLCLKLRPVVEAEPADRAEAARLVAGFPAALSAHLRGSARLQDVPGFADDPADPAHVPAYLAARLYDLLDRARADGRLDGFAFLALDEHARALMDVCGACEKIRNTPLPDSYRALVRHGLVLGFLVAPWHLAHVMGFGAIPAQASVVYFLFGVEMIAEEVEEPFGRGGDDLPLSRFSAVIRQAVTQILGVDVPGALQPARPSSR